jgi:hypothetical protein
MNPPTDGPSGKAYPCGTCQVGRSTFGAATDPRLLTAEVERLSGHALYLAVYLSPR